MDWISWIEAVVAFAAIGAAIGRSIDVLLRKKGRQEVNERLAEWWIRMYVHWDNFAKREAELFLALIDKLAGKKLFSTKRLIFSALVVSIMFAIVTTFAAGNPFLWYNDLPPYLYAYGPHFLT